jgi:hypothetical protein
MPECVSPNNIFVIALVVELSIFIKYYGDIQSLRVEVRIHCPGSIFPFEPWSARVSCVKHYQRFSTIARLACWVEPLFKSRGGKSHARNDRFGDATQMLFLRKLKTSGLHAANAVRAWVR